jgi:hypothetical protein
MTTNTNQKPEYQFYINWLRILLILSLFLFHIWVIRKVGREPDATLVSSQVMAETDGSLSEIRQKSF